jgi:hypothetical protein
MTASPNPQQRWRPAPFAMHGPDRRRVLLEHALALCCLLVFVAALLPRPAGHEGALALPVDYHRIELPERAPVVIAVALPAGDYDIEPESLGYFDKPGQFIYTAAVARGVIFGRVNGRAVVLEVAAPQDSQAFLQYHLDQIRAKVAELNHQENLLAASRTAAAAVRGQLDQAVAKQYAKLGARAGRVDLARAKAFARQAQATPAEARASLERLAEQQAEQKQLYYECQRTRLGILGQQAALQVALARLPEPHFNELLSLGDDQVVREAVQAELGRLEQAWQARADKLGRELDKLPPPAPVAADTEPAPLPGMPPRIPDAPTQDDAAAELARVLRETRRTQLAGELAELKPCLGQLARIRAQALSGQPPAWTTLPRLKFTPRRLAQPSLASLPGYSAVLGLDGAPEPTLALLEQLARRFEGWPAAKGQRRGKLGLPAEGYPFELPYGLLAIDQVLRNEEAAAGKAEAPGIDAGIQARLAFPDNFGLAQLDLAYLRCLDWYAQQERGVLLEGK